MSVSLIYFRGSGAEDVRDSRSWVGGVVLVLDGRGLRLDCSEDEN